ncbi:MAG: deoxyribose-phosphate aldolase [bacterium]|nr:deoxyribose-phosphate aldolase [bacterium]
MPLKYKTPLVEFNKDELRELLNCFTPESIAAYLDVTDLKADSKSSKIKEIAQTAIKYKCASVCVNPVEVDLLPKLLKKTKIKETYVMDFPLGKLPINQKAYITKDTIEKSRELRNEGKGLIDIDIVINTGRFKTDPAYTLEEINAMCEAADGEHIKVIVRSSELTEKEIYKVSEIVAESKAHFIKNSTGMDAYGALPEHIRIMREVVGNSIGVKAAGGISDAETAIHLFYAGAKEKNLHNPNLFRIGTSKPENIILTMSNLLNDINAFLDTEIIPCTICPYSHISKVRPEIVELNDEKCKKCIYFHYRKNVNL